MIRIPNPASLDLLRAILDGGRTVVKGSVDEAVGVKENEAVARMIADTQFEAETDTQPGANTFAVEATDGAGNRRQAIFPDDDGEPNRDR